MNYFIRHSDPPYRFKLDNKSNHPIFKFFFITKPKLKKAIEDHKLVFIDVIEILDDFGIRYSVKVNFIGSDDKPNPSIYLLASNRYRVLSYESIDSLISSLRACGYHSKKRDLNIIPHFSEI